MQRASLGKETERSVLSEKRVFGWASGEAKDDDDLVIKSLLIVDEGNDIEKS